MTDSATFLITAGALLLLGLATDAVGRLTRLPRVTLLLLFGVAVGPAALDLLPVESERWFWITANTALVMVGFLLGERFTPKVLRESGRPIVSISIVAVVTTATIVTLGLLAFGAPPALALLLGAISTSTAPAATADVVDECGADTRFSRVLLGVVALDDAWGLVVFGLVLSAVGMVSDGSSALAALAQALREVGGALVLGGALGVPLALLSGRVRAGEPTLLEALGAVFLCGGLALYLKVSPILAAMTLGAVVANFARHHTRPFHAIEGIERPFLILFFVFAGASLHFDSITLIGGVGAVYVVTRALGRLAGSWLGSVAGDASDDVKRWMGLALMPQAGIALGIALIAAERFPDLGKTLLPVAIGSTVIFELLGPLCTRYALLRTGSATVDT